VGGRLQSFYVATSEQLASGVVPGFSDFKHYSEPVNTLTDWTVTKGGTGNVTAIAHALKVEPGATSGGWARIEQTADLHGSIVPTTWANSMKVRFYCSQQQIAHGAYSFLQLFGFFKNATLTTRHVGVKAYNGHWYLTVADGTTETEAVIKDCATTDAIVDLEFDASVPSARGRIISANGTVSAWASATTNLPTGTTDAGYLAA